MENNVKSMSLGRFLFDHAFLVFKKIDDDIIIEVQRGENGDIVKEFIKIKYVDFNIFIEEAKKFRKQITNDERFSVWLDYLQKLR